MTIWFTADTHFGCEKLVENTRPEFSSIEEHDANLINQINLTVERNDTLVIVGDWCKEKPGKYRQQLKKGIHTMFILGNHDKEAKIRRVFGGNVWHNRMIKVGSEKIWCCHYPTAFWDKCFLGVPHLYGHIHNSLERERMMSKGMPGRRSMDVGVDHAKAWLGEYRPWSYEDVISYLKLREGHDMIKEEDRWQNDCT